MIEYIERVIPVDATLIISSECHVVSPNFDAMIIRDDAQDPHFLQPSFDGRGNMGASLNEFDDKTRLALKMQQTLDTKLIYFSRPADQSKDYIIQCDRTTGIHKGKRLKDFEPLIIVTLMLFIVLGTGFIMVHPDLLPS